jgi:hypothetical protein
MENRERDKMSKNTTGSSGGDVNRETSSRIGNRNDESSADFGQNIGRSENLENEPSRRSGGGQQSGQSGRQSGRESGSLDSESSNVGSGIEKGNRGEGEH